VLVAVLADAQQLVESVERSFRRWLLANQSLPNAWRGRPDYSRARDFAAGRPDPQWSGSGCAACDAAGFLDPITGGGMTQALMTAEIIEPVCSRPRKRGDSWLWKFERAPALLFDYRILTRMVLSLPTILVGSTTTLDHGCPAVLFSLVIAFREVSAASWHFLEPLIGFQCSGGLKRSSPPTLRRATPSPRAELCPVLLASSMPNLSLAYLFSFQHYGLLGAFTNA